LQGANDQEKLEIVRGERNRIIGTINIASVQEALAKCRTTSGGSLAETTITTQAATEAEKHRRVHVVVTKFGIGGATYGTGATCSGALVARPIEQL